MNLVILHGFVPNPPQIRKTSKKGMDVANFSIGVEKAKKSKTQNQDATLYIKVVAWGRQAQVCAQYLKPGSTVLVQGHLEEISWTGKDGVEHKEFQVSLEYIRFTGKKLSKDIEEKEISW